VSTIATIAALRSTVEQLVSAIATTAALRSTVEQLVSALAAITAGFFNNYGAAATFAALVSAEFNNISTTTKGNQQYNTIHLTYSNENQEPFNPFYRFRTNPQRACQKTELTLLPIPSSDQTTYPGKLSCRCVATEVCRLRQPMLPYTVSLSEIGRRRGYIDNIVKSGRSLVKN